MLRYFTAGESHGEALIARTKDAFDQAIPSAASMAALLCLRLGGLTDPTLTVFGEKQLERIAAAAVENPFGMGQAVLGIHRLAKGSTDLVVVGPRDRAATLVQAAYGVYAPDRTIAWVDTADAASVEVAKVLAEGKAGIEGEAVAYVCRGRTCSLPVRTPEELVALLRAHG